MEKGRNYNPSTYIRPRQNPRQTPNAPRSPFSPENHRITHGSSPLPRQRSLRMPHPSPSPSDTRSFLPTTPEEAAARGCQELDVVFVTGDAYVDHPSFAMALLGRLLEDEGLRVAILSQPDWRSCQPWRTFGRPRVCFAISAGNMDSMLNHYTANRKVRNDDAYSPGGQIGRRPDRATAVYCQRAREAYQGGAHHRRRSRGQPPPPRPLRLLERQGPPFRSSSTPRPTSWSTAWASGRSWKSSAAWPPANRPASTPRRPRRGLSPRSQRAAAHGDDTILLPSYERVAADKRAFAEMTRIAHLETNPYNARRLVQPHGREAVVVNPPAVAALRSRDGSRLRFALHAPSAPQLRRSAPFPPSRSSRTRSRSCAAASAAARSARSRPMKAGSSRAAAPSRSSGEIEQLAENPDFKGVISDIGGPTANMYRMNCSRPEVRAKCRRLSCVHPTICKLLSVDHGPLIELMQHACVSSRACARSSSPPASAWTLPPVAPSTCSELVEHHVGGHLKVAPEHTDPEVLRLMKKPSIDDFERLRQTLRQGRPRGRQGNRTSSPTSSPATPASDLAAMITSPSSSNATATGPSRCRISTPAPSTSPRACTTPASTR